MKPFGVLKFEVTLPDNKKILLEGMAEALAVRKLFWRGFDGVYPGFSEVFFQLSTSSNVIIDLGSYFGYYSLIAAKANPEARIFSVDPVESSMNLQTRIFTSNAVSNVTLCQVAISERSGKTAFYMPSFSHSSIPNIGSLVNRFGPGTHYSDRGSIKIEVDAMRLDEFVDFYEIGRVDLIKFFVEEMEMSVFKSGKSTLEKYRPDLIGWIFYRNTNVERLGQILKEIGYSFFVFKGPELVPCRSLEHARKRGDLFGHASRSAVFCTTKPDERMKYLRRAY